MHYPRGYVGTLFMTVHELLATFVLEIFGKVNYWCWVGGTQGNIFN